MLSLHSFEGHIGDSGPGSQTARQIELGLELGQLKELRRALSSVLPPLIQLITAVCEITSEPSKIKLKMSLSDGRILGLGVSIGLGKGKPEGQPEGQQAPRQTGEQQAQRQTGEQLGGQQEGQPKGQQRGQPEGQLGGQGVDPSIGTQTTVILPNTGTVEPFISFSAADIRAEIERSRQKQGQPEGQLGGQGVDPSIGTGTTVILPDTGTEGPDKGTEGPDTEDSSPSSSGRIPLTEDPDTGTEGPDKGTEGPDTDTEENRRFEEKIKKFLQEDPEDTPSTQRVGTPGSKSEQKGLSLSQLYLVLARFLTKDYKSPEASIIHKIFGGLFNIGVGSFRPFGVPSVLLKNLLVGMKRPAEAIKGYRKFHDTNKFSDRLILAYHELAAFVLSPLHGMLNLSTLGAFSGFLGGYRNVMEARKLAFGLRGIEERVRLLHGQRGVEKFKKNPFFRFGSGLRLLMDTTASIPLSTLFGISGAISSVGGTLDSVIKKLALEEVTGSLISAGRKIKGKNTSPMDQIGKILSLLNLITRRDKASGIGKK
ncbi:hypothetical protein D6810_01875 [Candidatus Dojkabacteria bacterium]|uniref:Uncharacterized protein n=1 Tax=Candidatus Dojkabacteria bacterium TaxID=2099670 RepID=A0A3M0Z100_9BACT|nr:MAG: hypothetical protein D6810_01875 [Candidatus Dojkabacteria bacterium]